MDAASTTRRRSKHACKNCRRKKARCPAERPICSFCKRLNQICEYDDPLPPEQPVKAVSQPRASKLADRVAELESQIAMLTDSNSVASSSIASSPNRRASLDLASNILTGIDLFQTATMPARQMQTSPPEHFDSNRRKYHNPPPDHIVLAAIDAYFKTCYNHPCIFFNEARFRDDYAYGCIPTFLLLALVASVTHLLVDPWFENDHAAVAKHIAQAAWQQILADFLPNEDANSVELVQAIGLMSLLDFSGENHQAGTMKLRIAITIAQNLHLNLDPEHLLPPLEQEERRHVFWTLYLMDRVSALVLDRPCLIRDDECSLKLPEDVSAFHTKQCNQIPCLNDTMTSSPQVSSNCAKKMIAVSILGSLVFFCHGSQLQFGQFPLQETGLYYGLVSQADRLGELLQQHTSGTESSSTRGTGQSEHYSQPDVSSEFQHCYAKIAFHVAQILVNHPFLLRRHPGLLEISHEPTSLHHRLSMCQQHAVGILPVVAKAQQVEGFPYAQLFLGWVVFSVAIVHCLFMHSPDMMIAQTSRECFQKARKVIYDLSLVEGTPRSQRYLAMLDFLGKNAGFSSWLVDPSFPRFNHPSKSTSYWRFTDFDWLCEQFCVGTNPLLPAMSDTPGIAAPQKPKPNATVRVTSSENLVGNMRNPLAPQSMHGNIQPPREDGSGYVTDSRPLQPTSTFSLERLDLLEDLNSDDHDLMSGVSSSKAGPESMYPGLGSSH